MATAFTLFGMNVVHDRAPTMEGPTSYQEYIEFLKQQVHQPSAVTPSCQPSSSVTSSPTHHSKRDKNIRIQCQVRARIPTNEGGEMYLHLYKNNQDTKEHLAIVYGDLRSRSLDDAWANETILNRVVRGAYYGRLEEIVAANDMDIISKLTPDQMVFLEQQQQKAKQQWEQRHENEQSSKIPLVRIHSECFTGETVHSGRCDCGEQLDEAMRQMQLAGRGVIVYLRQEGRGIGLLEKLKAYNLQDLGHDTVAANVLLNHPADGRTYGIANAILKDLQISQVHLLTNNPDKIKQLESYGDIQVLERHEMIPRSWSATPSSTTSNDNNNHLHILQPHASPLLLDRTPSSSPALGMSTSSVFDLPKKELDRYLAVKVKKMGHILNLPDSLNT
ncbi:GTP cyclohydrolase II-domain-containing protein [Halteromyces radiatus]|uniref:GTP cyclohydrolase II-domain-containing protein n=1 Tax=Halteromyces radiatus TaxID=101107 RepID=UPI00221EC0E1|nr:GTP cyclohydrolase II-domain-containing protein [Halteromyces radiatus]KAI8089113.1 GTP cyclohydrolase II-domain-containing protein [Halteromyces radiatus]